MALSQIMLNNDGSMMSPQQISDFYQPNNNLIANAGDAMTQPNFVDKPVLTPSQLNELQPIANNLIASGPQQNYNLPPLPPQLQPDNTVPSFVNNPNLSVQQKQAMLNAQPQQVVADVSPQSMAVAGAARQGIDWRGALAKLGGYLSAAGQEIDPTQTTMGAGLAGAGTGVLKHQQAIKNFDTFAPIYKQMGYDVSELNPTYGGAGLDTTPAKMIDLQSKVEDRKAQQAYRQLIADYRMQQMQQKVGQGSGYTVGQLMQVLPQFKAQMQKQYNFANGANADVLNQRIDKNLLPFMFSPQPKTSILDYTGGTTSRQIKTGRSDIYHHSNGGGKSGGRTTRTMAF